MRVRFKSDSEKQHIDDIGTLISSEHPNETGIVYCLSRKDTETTATQLRENHHINAAAFHANIDDRSLQRCHEQWRSGRLHVVCATIAFGMGINNAGCRFVIHSTMSKGLDCYWQEAGRAGRDGNPASCIIFSRGADLCRLSSMVYDSPDYSSQLERLYAAFRYVLSPPRACRRVALMEWFGQPVEHAVRLCKKGGNCDVCARANAMRVYGGEGGFDEDEEGITVDVQPYMLDLVLLVHQLSKQKPKVKVTLIKVNDDPFTIPPGQCFSLGFDLLSSARCMIVGRLLALGRRRTKSNTRGCVVGRAT